MNQNTVHINHFFGDLVIGADRDGAHHYKDVLESAIDRFIRDESKETAYSIYEIFFGIYGYTTNGTNFMQLLEKMRRYEENAAVLTSQQRDHFIHSINVFLLGLAVYQANPVFHSMFDELCYEQNRYVGQLNTAREEFFFRWGLAALCHDIGYPIEIINNQINDFINFINHLRPADAHIYARIEYDRFEFVNTIPEEARKREFIRKYYETYDSCVYVDLLKPVDLLAHSLHTKLRVDLLAIKERLDHYVAESSKSGRVDHGFFSALILLKWFGYLVQASGNDPDLLYVPVLDCASAVLLHNFYNVALVNNSSRPNVFNLPPLLPEKHPIAFLLILCDELQEWNREAYGELDKLRVSVPNVTITLDEQHFSVTYIVDQGAMPEEFVGRKMNTLNTLLDMRAIFPTGIIMGCEAIGELPKLPYEVPPLLLGKMEQLAIAIHDRYNRTTEQLYPDKIIEYPSFSQLPKDRKYYNLRSAMELPDEAAAVNCEIRQLEDGNPAFRVMSFTEDEVEILAKFEHDRWVRGRSERGWHYGKQRDESLMSNPDMVPYEQLDEVVKELDRAPARNLPELLEGVGLGIFRKQNERVESFTQAQIEMMARKVHEYYMALWAKSHPNETPKTFDEITEEKRESNRRQARGIPNKMRHIGCMLLPKGAAGHGEPVEAFPVEMVEWLAKIEHDEWSGEKVANGWTYNPVRNEALKHNEYLVGYDQLTEVMKEYDRDSIRNIPKLADACGYAVYRQD